MRSALFDIEANGLLDTVTTVWCICVIDLDTGEEWSYGPERIPEGLSRLSDYDRLVGHNVLRYDFPVLKKLHSWDPPGEVRDTKVVARLKYPNQAELDYEAMKAGKLPSSQIGKHSIEAWGYRLGKPKLHADIEDWSKFTVEMAERCMGDCRTNVALWKHLKADAYSQDAIELEQDIDVVTNLMEIAGVPFDQVAAGRLHGVLMDRKGVLEDALKAQFEPWLAKDGPTRNPKKPFQRNGVWTVGPNDHLKWVHFNPRSNQHVERVLRKLGWVPEVFTPSGQAELNDKIIDDIVARFPEMAGLGEYKMIEKRLGQLIEGDKSLLNCVGPDGRIHAAYNPMGTATSRSSHFNPNIAQVPSPKKPYGKDFRELFRAPEGWVFCGADQAALEARGLGHFLAKHDGGEYGRMLLEADPHWANTQALGFVDSGTERDKGNQLHVIVREGSKTWFYAFLYGAGALKLGTTTLKICLDANAAGFPQPLQKFFGGELKPSKEKLQRVGAAAKKRFLAATPALGKVVSQVAQTVHNHGALPGLDGRVIPVRSEHSGLNFLIQSAGAIICKRWVVESFKEMSAHWRHGWDGDFVFGMWVHDEIQVICKEALAKQVGEILVRNAINAGERYKTRIPLGSEYAIGSDWYGTH